MAENISQRIIQNEIDLMQSITSQCNEETLVNRAKTFGDMRVQHYKLPSGLHVYCEEPLDLPEIYRRDIHNRGTFFYITAEEVDILNPKQIESYYFDTIKFAIKSKAKPFIEYAPNNQLSYKIDRTYFGDTKERNDSGAMIEVRTRLEQEKQNSIKADIVTEDIRTFRTEVTRHENGSEYITDIFQKIIDEMGRFETTEMGEVSKQIKPFFQMLAIEKQRLQDKSSFKQNNNGLNVENEEARMNEMKSVIEGLKKLQLTQDEIASLENLLKDLRNSNEHGQEGQSMSEESKGEK